MLLTHLIVGTAAGAIDVAAGQTVISSGVISGAAFQKIGTGTMVLNGINTDTVATFAGGGTVIAGTNQPFAASAGTSVNLQGGTLSLPNLGVATSYVTGVLNYAGGGCAEPSGHHHGRRHLQRPVYADWETPASASPAQEPPRRAP